MTATVRRLTDTTDTEVTKLDPPAPSQRLQTADTPFPGDYAGWFVGCHGGAGTSTLAASLAPFGDAGRIIPAANNPAMVILVAATHREGLEAAGRAITQFKNGDVNNALLLGLMLVDVTGPAKVPRSLAKKRSARENVVRNMAVEIWSVPHIPEWTAMLHDDLPEWDPMPDEDDEVLTDKQILKSSATDHPPLSVVDQGREILDLARTTHAQSKK